MTRRGPGSGLDRKASIEAALRHLAPAIPTFEAGVVTDRALDSRGLSSAYPEQAAWLALVAYARHAMTDYDALLEDGYDADSARFFVLDALNEILADWGVGRRVTGTEPEGPAVDPGPARS